MMQMTFDMAGGLRREPKKAPEPEPKPTVETVSEPCDVPAVPLTDEELDVLRTVASHSMLITQGRIFGASFRSELTHPDWNAVEDSLTERGLLRTPYPNECADCRIVTVRGWGAVLAHRHRSTYHYHDKDSQIRGWVRHIDEAMRYERRVEGFA